MGTFWNRDDLKRLFASETLPDDLAAKIDSSAEARRELAAIMRMVGSAAKLAATPDVVGRIGNSGPALLAASSGYLSPARMGAEAGVHAIFVDPETLKGCVRALVVRLVPANSFGSVKHPSVRCDAVMMASIERGVRAAVLALGAAGYQTPDDGVAIEWRIGNDDDEPTVYTGASLGLAAAVATASVLTGAPIAYEAAVSGAVDGIRVMPVHSIAEKFRTVAESGKISQLLIPVACVADLPHDARQCVRPRVLPVENVEEAIKILIGPELGLGAHRLAADTAESTTVGPSVYLRLWEDRGRSRISAAATRSLGGGGIEPAEIRRIGDTVSFGLYASADCHVTLINRGSSGKIQCLAPSLSMPDTRLFARQDKFFPSFELQGPAGTENLVALATRKPPHEDLRDFLANIDAGAANMVDLLTIMSSPQVLGTATLQLKVEEAAATMSVRSLDSKPVAASSIRWLAFDLN